MGLTVKGYAACLLLFSFSSSVTLLYRSTEHSLFSSPAPPLTPHGVAFATFLSTTPNPAQQLTDEQSASIDDADDGYFISARVLIYQLLHSEATRTNSSIPFVVACTNDISPRKRARLEKDGATVVVVEKLASSWALPVNPRWNDVLAKLRLFELGQYSKILFIDADTLVTGPLDDAFLDEATLSQPTKTDPGQIKGDEADLPHSYAFAAHADSMGPHDQKSPEESSLNTYMNCGFFVFAPSKALFKHYVSVLDLPNRFDPRLPEQNLLNYVHRQDGNMPWKHLWWGWNVNWPTVKALRRGVRSFHAKYWTEDLNHDPILKAIWRQQRSEMQGFYRGQESLQMK